MYRLLRKNAINATAWYYFLCFEYNSFCLFDLIIYVPSTIFQLNRVESSRVEPLLS